MTSEGNSSFQKRMMLASLAGMIASALAIMIITFAAVEPASRGGAFWSRLIWSIVLVSLLWAYVGGFFSLIVARNKAMKGIGGILPSFGVLLFSFVLISFALMAVAAAFPNSQSLDLIANSFRFLGIFIIIVLVYFSWAAGMVDTESMPDGLSSPRQLSQLIKDSELSLEARVNNGNERAPGAITEASAASSALKRLREVIYSSLPHVGRIGRDESYRVFCEEVKSLSDACNSNGATSESFYSDIESRASSLAGKAKSIAHGLQKE